MNFRKKVKLPLLVRQFLAEVLGTFLLVLFGGGAVIQSTGIIHKQRWKPPIGCRLLFEPAPGKCENLDFLLFGNICAKSEVISKICDL